MSWYRIAHADYPESLRGQVFFGESEDRIPRQVTLETSQLEKHPSAVNVVYYYDLANDIECGDFFFESISEALDWCEETLLIDRKSVHFYTPFMKVG